MQFLRFFLAICLIAASVEGCGKKEFLDKKPATNVFIPSTLSDFYALLDNESVMIESPVLGEVSADNYYISDSYWQSLKPKERNAYMWAPDIYERQGKVEDWNMPYRQVFYANVVLDGLQHLAMTGENEQDYKMVKGMAHFLRAFAFYNLASIFAPAYDAATATHDPGIPLRLNPGVEETSTRATVAQTYDQIIADLQAAAGLLPDDIVRANLNRPTKPAAYAMLARVFLSMRRYDQAGLNADHCLQLYSELINYDTVKRNALVPFIARNRETLLQNRLYSESDLFRGFNPPECIVDSNLYASYEANDLRKDIFYFTGSGKPTAKGSYTGLVFSFSGLATDEVYLIRAECLAREQKTEEAMTYLNTLLEHRWRAGTFTPLTAAGPDEALNIILRERRKEMPFRGVRWTDLKRLNKEGRNIVLTRKLNGITYTLQPGSNLYVLPIPPDVLDLTGMEDNKR